MRLLSSLIEHQLPDFISTEHDVFVAFLQEYYKWMEQEGSILNFLGKFQDNMDVDLADDAFLDQFIEEFADTFPKDPLIPKNTLLKYIKEFYIAKGTESSFKFLFTVLFNSDIFVEYPRELIQTSSGGNYVAENYAYISADNFFKVDIDTDSNITVLGQTSGETLVVDSVSQGFIGDDRILILNLSSFTGPLTAGETVDFTVDNVTVHEVAYSGINRIDVTDGGSNYKLNDEITITDAGSGDQADAFIKNLSKGGLNQYTIDAPGTGYEVGDLVYAVKPVEATGYAFVATVAEVDEGSANEILGINIINPGYEYSAPTNAIIKSPTGTGAAISLNGDDIGKISEIEVNNSGYGYINPGDITINVVSATGSGATLTPVLSTIYNQPAKYVDANDWPSNYSRITDSYYYQQFSYVIRSNVSPSAWKERIKKIAHPSGAIVFGNYLLESEVELFGDPEIDPIYVTSGLQRVFTYFTEVVTTPVTAERTITKNIPIEDGCASGNTITNLDYEKFLDSFDWTIREYAEYTIGDVYEGNCWISLPYSVDSQIDFTIDSLGSLIATESPDTMTSTGDLSYNGSLAATEASDTMTSTGDVPVDGSLASTESADTIVSTGDVPAEGLLASTEASDTIVSTGDVGIAGLLASTEASDTITSTGDVPVDGSLASTEASDTITSTGDVDIEGLLASTEATDSWVSTGTVV